MTLRNPTCCNAHHYGIPLPLFMTACNNKGARDLQCLSILGYCSRSPACKSQFATAYACSNHAQLQKCSNFAGSCVAQPCIGKECIVNRFANDATSEVRLISTLEWLQRHHEIAHGQNWMSELVRAQIHDRPSADNSCLLCPYMFSGRNHWEKS